MPNRTLLYFEDTESMVQETVPLLKDALGDFAEVERFVATEDSQQMYDARLEQEITSRMSVDSEVVFILSDADLARTASFTGLSDANVNKVAGKLGIPAAFYSSNLVGVEFVKADQAGDGRILLDRSNPEAMVVEVNLLVRGFCSISEALRQIADRPTAERPRDTASLLAALLGRPEMKNRVKLYISGDQRVGAELLASPSHNVGRQATIFGTWIYDSLLKYPGMTVGSVAAASYLGIAVDEFSKADVQELFADAIYKGPFQSTERPLWWRDRLDEMLLEADAEDGAAFAAEKLNRDIPPCICSESHEAPAGFFCMITKQPVSEERSIGGVSWFPPGADLARIAESKYDELAPWLAI
jgi:hypothetical protein